MRNHCSLFAFAHGVPIALVIHEGDKLVVVYEDDTKSAVLVTSQSEWSLDALVHQALREFTKRLAWWTRAKLKSEAQRG